MIKLIVTDMDGTFLDSDHCVRDEFWDVYKRLKEKGIIFASASGRQYYSLTNKLDRIKGEVLFVAENGTYVMYKNKELFVNSMDRKDVEYLIKKAKKINGARVVLCGKKAGYMERANDELEKNISEYYGRFQVVEDILDVEDDVLKISIYKKDRSESDIHPHFIEDEDNYKVTVSGKDWVDIVNIDANKGVAIDYIQNLWGIKPEETMAFGDFLNDVEMLQDAYYSYAMEDAHPELKKVAKEVIGSNDDGAVIKKIVEIALGE